MNAAWVPLVVVGAALSLAQEQSSSPQFRAVVQGVRIDALVSNGGQPIVGLAAEDFEILDNGVPQRVDRATNATHLAVVLLLDTSPSVLTNGKPGDLIRAAQATLDALLPGDHVALVTFGTGAVVQVHTTADPSAVSNALRQLAGGPSLFRRLGGSAIWDATFVAAAQVVGRPERPAVVLLSDGEDSASWLFTNEAANARWTDSEKRHVFDVLRSAGVVVDQILVPPVNRTDEVVLGVQTAETAARETGGNSFSARHPRLASQLRTRLAALRAGYVLTYVPTADISRVDGWHALTVRLRHRKGRVEARPGYYSIPPK